MIQQQIVDSFVQLGERLENLTREKTEDIEAMALAENPWFTAENVALAIEGIRKYLHEEKVKGWLKSYTYCNNPSRVGIIMAGNIPLVGFHDLLCVLLSGNLAVVKTSSKDSALIEWLLREFVEINQEAAARIEIVSKLQNIEAVIATGSDNSARQFDFYFSKYPNLIRKNRTSVAVLNGSEKRSDFEALSKDVCQYFGLGCRNVSKVYVPRDFGFNELLEVLAAENTNMDHHKYANNYDYNKAIMLVNGREHFDNGSLLLTNSEEMVSPIATLYYQYYDSLPALERELASQEDKIQCVIGKDGWFGNSIDFGKAQQPELQDYADNVDTMQFLNRLSVN